MVGPGKVGASLASWAVAGGAEAIALGVRREDEAARLLAGRLDCVTVPLPRLGSADQDLLLVTVPDPALDEVARTLRRRKQAAVVLHTSGSRDASALAPLAARGSAVGSFHPLKAFPHPLLDPGHGAGVLFGIDGDRAARDLAARLAQAWGASVATIPPAARLPYHFAATLAAGGVVTLLAAVSELMEASGVPRAVLDGYFELARGALTEAQAAEDPAAALTGPVARGDRATVEAELAAVEAVAPELLPAVLAMARESLRQRQRLGELPEAAVALAEALVRS